MTKMDGTPFPILAKVNFTQNSEAMTLRLRSQKIMY